MELELIKNSIIEIRGKKVILDFELAKMYQTETKRLKESVRRNIRRFPSDFMFELTYEEWNELRTQFATSKKGGTTRPAFAFTEQGVAMLSSVLNSEIAIEVNIAIMRAFVEIRNKLSYKNELSQQLKDLKQELEARLGEQDTQIIEIYDVLDQLMDKKENDERNKIGYK